MRKPSGDSGNALFISAEAPYPPVGGGAMRSASLLEYLAQHYRVDAVLFAHSHSPGPAAALPAGKVRRYTEVQLPEHSRTSAARFWRNGKRLLLNRPPLLDRFSGQQRPVADFIAGQAYDVAVIEHFWCAPYLEAIRSASSATKAVLDLHNIESIWHGSLGAGSQSWQAFAHRRFAAAYRQRESEWLPQFDGILAASAVDAGRVAAINPRVVVYPNAIPAVREEPRREEDMIAFSGNLEFEPNRAAVAYFARQVWPLLRARFPNLRWRIIGKNPQAVANLVNPSAGSGGSNIELTGPVEDALASLAQAKVAVVPVLSGSGTRIKILEAWAAGTPVVSTTIGAEGLEAENGRHLLLADQPSEFAEAIGSLLADSERRAEMGRAGQLLCQERYTWASAWSQLFASGLL
jgi:glycosyltransferase involved in cell wall biosynthesis